MKNNISKNDNNNNENQNGDNGWVTVTQKKGGFNPYSI